MRRLRHLLLTVASVLWLSAGTALATQHLNAYSLQGDFICVSCHEPLNQVNSPEAIAEKQTLSSLVAKGLDYSQIKTQMVNIYGQDVLARPPAHGVNLLIYILPPLVLVGGLGLLAYNLPRWRQRSRLQAAAGAGPPAQSDRRRATRPRARRVRPLVRGAARSGRYIESGADTPSIPSTRASRSRVAVDRATRKASADAGSAPATLQSR